jgi:signal transduction histidine kinase/CheY-like chemotaxis protein
MILSGKVNFVADYPFDFRIRFLPSLLVISIYCYVFARIGEMVHSSLHQNNEQLNQVVKELRGTEEELRRTRDELEIRVRRRTAELLSANDLLRREIEDRKRVESALSESHATYATVLDSIDCDLYAVDLQSCRILLANRHLRDRLGVDPVGRTCHEAVMGRSAPCSDCPSLPPVQSSESPVGFLPTEELDEVTGSWHLKQSRNIRWIDGREVRLHVRTDITPVKRAQEEKLQLETQLRHAQKMEAVGTLAGGIAHDFNNILQGIQGYAEVLLLDKEEGSRERERLEGIQQAAERGGILTRQLLAFSRTLESSLQPVDLKELIEQKIGFLERILPKMIEIEMRVAPDLGRVHADPTQMEQVLLNLAVNARDAMEGGGRLRIDASNVHLEKRFCEACPGLDLGRYVLLEVSDNGHGMDAETVEHIFEPFFTTKESGKGTGLGLPMVYGIVKNHHGCIQCKSEPGKGTSFKIYLPTTDDPCIGEQSPEAKPVAGGEETILLVDDEDFIRTLASEALQHFGYHIICAETGEDALKVYEEEGDRIRLVILDLVMPGMGGRQCLLKLLEKKPQPDVIIASGYSEETSEADLLKLGARRFINKPYNIQQLLNGIREVLDERHAKRDIAAVPGIHA